MYMQSQKNPELEIDRSLSWVSGRKDKNGNFKSEVVRLKAKEIVSYLYCVYLFDLSGLLSKHPYYVHFLGGDEDSSGRREGCRRRI